MFSREGATIIRISEVQSRELSERSLTCLIESVRRKPILSGCGNA